MAKHRDTPLSSTPESGAKQSYGKPSGGPGNPFAAPVANFPSVSAPSKGTPFKIDPSYNYHAVTKQIKEAGEGKAKPILKEKRKEFARQFESGAIKSRSELRDSIQSTMTPGSSRKEIRVATKDVAGRTTVGQSIRQTGMSIKKAITSKGGRAAKAECKSGNCKNPRTGF
tara:strand:- start:996 stop:1505 length:510 start_codon:yes stop_codon:yes gene_type:complete